METAIDYLTKKHDWQVSSDPTTYPGYPEDYGYRNYWDWGDNGQKIYYDADCNGYHRAHDLFNRKTDEVPAVTHGTVVRATKKGSFGGEVIIRDLNGYIWVYGHLQRNSIKLKKGDKVRQSDIIGLQGNSNYYDNPMSKHLHLQLLAPGSSTKLGTKWYCPGLQIDRYNINNGDYDPVKPKGNDNVASYMKLPQLVDKRGKLTTSKQWRAPKRQTSLRNCERAIHHSLTGKNLAGSTPEGFANYHVLTLDWPCIGYHFTVTPSRVVQTPNGPRAEISINVNLDLVTYHVGNANDLAIGIVIAGDYRTDTLDKATMASFADLINALDKDKIAMGGMFSHHQYPGYAWKKCSVFSPKYALENGRKEVSGVVVETKPPKESVPETYTVQQGDTLYAIAHGEDFTVADLMSWNNIADPTTLSIGQKLKLKGAKGKAKEKQTPYTVGDWNTNKHGTQYIEAHGTFTVGSEPIMTKIGTGKNGGPFRGATDAGYAQPGTKIKYTEMVRSWDGREGFIMFGYDDNGTWKYIPYREWYKNNNGRVGPEWGKPS